MNKTYRSIWNASLGCYVAAPESATSHTAGSSRSRTARAHPMMRSKSVLVMEPRLLFDGAMVATAIELDSGTDAPVLEEADVGEEPAAEAPVAPAATDEPSAEALTEPETPTADDAAEAEETGAADATAADDTDLATAPEAPARTEVVFVDSRVTDPAAFGGEGREVVVVAADQDGIAQIASALAGRTGIDAIHIVSHGSDGQLSLGSGSVTAETLQSTQQAALQQIGQALTAEGDILIYACDYAAGSAGLEAIDLIADLTGADVAASSDATGHESLGGDWTLEQSTGAIETAELAPLAWMNALDFSFTGAGTVGALGMANNIMGAGVTVVSATYQGGATQSGTFTAGSGVTFGSDVLGFTSGTLLSTGEDAAGVAGPNSMGEFGSNALSGVDGDPTLNAMAGFPTFDAAILNIDFVPDVPPGGSVGDVGRMTLEIVFGSDEYLEYIGSINDVMEVTVNGQVVSLVPNASGGESTIGINSVNNTENPALFIDNTAGTYNTQMDAFTITIPMVFDVIVGQTNTIRLAVADAVDDALDSWMFIRADSGQTVVVAENDQVATAANLPITVDLTANDYSLAGGNLTLTHIQGDPVTQGQVITLGSGIQLTVGAGGQVTVTGNGSSAANDTFTYQVSNGMGGFASATVNVDVTAPNLNPPVAQDDIEAVTADATLSDSVLTNNGNGADTDPNGDPLSVVQVNLTGFTPGDPITLPSGALLTMNANGSYVYDPNGAFDGLADGATTTDSFSYTVTDGQGGNDTATVTITVTGVASNHAPVAVDDSFVANEDEALSLGSVMANDTDADGNLAGVDYYRGGTLDPSDYPVLASDQLLANWTSNADDGSAGGLDGRDVDSDVVQGMSSLTAGSGVTLTGNAVRQAVDVSGLDSATLAEARTNGDYVDVSFTTLDTVIDISTVALGVLDSDGLGGGYTITVELLPEGNPAQALTLVASHTLPGAPAPGGYTWDSVSVDGPHLLNPQTNYTVRVYLYGNPADGTAEFNDLHLFYNDRGAMDTSALAAGDQGGIFSFDDSGGVVFIPNGDFDDLAVGESRDTHWVYTLRDDQGASSSATVTVTVEGVNDAPVTAADSFDVDEDGAWVLDAVLDNDSDPEGDAMSISFSDMAGSNGGLFTMDDGGNLIFIPGSDFDDLNVGQSRQTTFTYQVGDAYGAQTASTVTVTVQGVNDAPVAVGDSFSVYEDDAVVLGDLTVNDSDVDGGVLAVDTSAVVAGDNGGLFSFDDGGNLVFVPNGDFNDLAAGESRSTRFDYTLLDGQGGSSLATVVVEVMGQNDAPVAADDTLAAYADHAMALGSALANDTDPEGNALQLEQVQAAGSNGGLLALDDSHNLIFNPDGAFDDLAEGETRDTSFSYTVADSLGGLSQALLTVTVTGVNDNPVAVNDAYEAGNRIAVTLGDPMVNDSDADGDALDLGPTSPGEGSHGGLFSVVGGSLVFDPDGAFDDLAEGESRETSFTYTVSDGQGGAASATVTVTVRGGEEPPVAYGQSELSYTNDVVFVDARIPDPQAFAVEGREVIVINLADDGLAQIAAALSGRTDIAAIHIVSHGGDGYLTLGNGDIDAASIESVHLPTLQSMAAALSEGGDILIYACDFAASEVGQNTMQLLAQYTLADVAASLGTTGHPTLNGNWVLEVAVGSVEAPTITPQNWVYALNQPVVGAPVAPVGPVQEALALSSVTAPSVTGGDLVEPVSPAAAALPMHTAASPRVLTADAGVRGLDAPETVRMVTLEEVFRQTLSPYLPAATDAVADTATSADPLWAAPAITVDTDLGRPEGWQPTAEFLDDALVHEALVNEELPEAREVDALELPRQHAAPGFAAQLARWSQWGNQRPLTRAAARA